MSSFKGTGVALVTPFNKHLGVDFEGLDNLLEHVLSGKVDYLVLFGTTGESPTLSGSEKKVIFNLVKKKIKGKLPIVYGVGSNNTLGLIKDLKDTNLKGADAILSVAPYYNRPTQLGLFEHFKTLAKYSPIPIIIYNIPGRTAINITADTITKLSKIQNIIGVKEASGDISQCMKIVNNTSNNFLAISGDDLLTFPLLSIGFQGVISVIANALPEIYSKMVRLALDKNIDEAKKIHYNLLNLMESLYLEGNPAGIKELLKLMKICSAYIRPPLTNVSSNLSLWLKTFISTINSKESVVSS